MKSPEKRAAAVLATRQWRAKNPERNRALNRRVYVAKREAVILAAKAWRLANRARRRIIAKRWDRLNPEKRRASRTKWSDAHPDRVHFGCAIEKIDRAKVYARDGGLCAICGRHVPVESFTLDHIIPLSKRGPHTYDNVTVAHHSCNSGKRDRNTPTQRPLFPRL